MSFANEEGRAVQWWEAPLLVGGAIGAPWCKVSEPQSDDERRRVDEPAIKAAMRAGAAADDGGGTAPPATAGDKDDHHHHGVDNGGDGSGHMAVRAGRGGPPPVAGRLPVVTPACRAKRDGQDKYFVRFLAELHTKGVCA
mmetsp:Transcript_46033/g.91836  ORF Transcript_46033/g.91836 Transcript_46033/m.91836 type:complete len:140 (-) Transcript_46033:198-617(-)|eukprot:CAMPEP_0174696030 /NCGR_PEP_ID=MMETSP1094-20130205/2275_1 /TAXON_ID=156173 /ORGANISM="Chrysochromulina brevifilum, Strain UTEX LB 985" /LENGTH=139 /DNA_ID=CAMNT_0015892693 /DNA_START=36 /DNA_END=455 /DNA_ORIENTATION=+